MGEGRLADPGDILDQQVAASEQPHQRELDHFILTPDNALDGALDTFE